MKKLLLLIGPLVLLLGLSAVVAQDDEETTVAVAESDDLGEFLTDAEGMTLYLFTNDSPGMSACDEGCLENWPAFTAKEPLTLPEGVPGELTLIEREDGTEMVAYNDMPLYYFAGHEAEGDTNGHEAGDVWFVVEPEEPQE
jgi:predicted lipoprotein with Yx(FWY)xxD motif